MSAEKKWIVVNLFATIGAIVLLGLYFGNIFTDITG